MSDADAARRAADAARRRPRDDGHRARLGARAPRCATPTRWERLPRRPPTTRSYLDAVVKETLRLRPVRARRRSRLLKAPVEHRRLRRSRRASRVAPNILPHAHPRPDIYPDPFAFRPGALPRARPPGTYTWIPFGGGVRRCLGASFALFEMKAVLRAVADAVEELEPDRRARRAPQPAARSRSSRASDGRIIVARRAAPARRVPPVPTGR